MEKAILKTLIYADIFDYPLRVYEIHKWLIGRKTTLRQVERALKSLSKKLKVKSKKGYYFLPKKDGLVGKRERGEEQSRSYLGKAKILVTILKIIPWIKLVGISGGLAMGNAKKSDDIDLFIITSKSRLWLSRFFALSLLSLTGQRRRVSDTGRKIAGKLCLNILVEEEKLAQKNRDIYIAHEVLQMKVLWERNGIYGKYLMDNEWVFRFLPNWITDTMSLRGAKRRSNLLNHSSSNKQIATSAFGGLAMTMELLAKWIQLKIMEKPRGMERIEDGALYFHPNDIRPKILAKYKKRVKIYSL